MTASEVLLFTACFGFLRDLVPESEEIWSLYKLAFQILEVRLGLRPKLHILLNYPKIILVVGPPRYSWSMRYESS